jgi:transmembrane 9 superfamily protein 2/4
MHVFTQMYSVGEPQDGELTCGEEKSKPLQLDETQTNTVRYTYRISWQVSISPLEVIVA